MQVQLLIRRPRSLAIAAIAFAVLTAACSGGIRPTLTTDRLVETPESGVETVAPTPASAEVAVDTAVDTATAPATPQLALGEVEQLVVQVLETFPHDATGFTQGLELYNGVFLESTGLYGESSLRRVDPGTGTVLQSVPINAEYFAEGLTRVDNQVIQLTWQENTAFYWDATTLERTKEVTYQGEGWGLCFDGTRLVMTDGTPELIFRDPVTFDEIGRIAVTLNGQDVFNLNEVECVDGVIWANVWQTDLIVRIDPATGMVNGVVDAVALDRPAEPQGAVLNGIAWDPSTQSFYVTGKLWPTMYRVNFVPAPAS